jgi:hypothetical protein
MEEHWDKFSVKQKHKKNKIIINKEIQCLIVYTDTLFCYNKISILPFQQKTVGLATGSWKSSFHKLH